jgi:hypothetical protein
MIKHAEEDGWEAGLEQKAAHRKEQSESPNLQSAD